LPQADAAAAGIHRAGHAGALERHGVPPVGRRPAPRHERPLAAGELTTGPDGDAVVRLPGGRELELRANARLKIKEGGGGITVEIEQGVIVSRTPEKSEPSFELAILTPFGITRVPKGASEASIGVADGKVTIEVAVGTIAFVDEAGRETTARASETIEVTLGKVQLLGPERPAATASSAEPVDVMLSAEQGPLLVRRPDEKRFVARRGLPAPPWHLRGSSLRRPGPHRGARRADPTRGVRPAASARRPERRTAGASPSPSSAGPRSCASTVKGSRRSSSRVSRGPVTVKTSEATTLAVAVGRAGPTLVVLAGSADILVGETRRRLEASGIASVSGQRVSVGTRPSSDVILPTTRGLRVYADALNDVTLSWPSQLQNAMVEAATDPEFEDLVLAGRVSGTAVTLPVPPGPTLYWRVRARLTAWTRCSSGRRASAPTGAARCSTSTTLTTSSTRPARRPRLLPEHAALADARLRRAPRRAPLPRAPLPRRRARSADRRSA
jgi:hypothetical protein